MKNFSTGLEHLLAELRLLDLLLKSQVLQMRAMNLLTEDERRGLYIPDELIDALLKQTQDQWTLGLLLESSQEEHELLQEIQLLAAMIEKLRQEILELVTNSQALPLPRLAMLFDLNPFEMQVLLVCLAPEIDLRYETLYAYTQNDVTRKRPTVDLAFKLLCRNVEERVAYRGVFDSNAPLLRHKLIRLFDDQQDREPTLLSRHMKVDQRIVDFLLDLPLIDQRLAAFTQRIDTRQKLSNLTLPEDLQVQLDQLVRFLQQETAIIFLYGPYGVGKQAIAEATFAAFNCSLLVADIRYAVQSGLDISTVLALLIREARLQVTGLYLAHFETLLANDDSTTKQRLALIHALEQFTFPVFVGSELAWHPVGVSSKLHFIEIELPMPDFSLRRQLWDQAMEYKKPLGMSDADISLLANQFVLSGRQIQDAVSEATTSAALRPDGQSALTKDDFYSAARAQSNQSLMHLAQKVELIYTWTDIILPQRARQQLQEVCASVKYRHIVFSLWEFERKLALGKGVNILFFGQSGTGKTMAASIVAKELERDLYKIDLSNVVSKYIGETEKNLSRIFHEAETSNAILFFDEADALFGKRSEVKDAHDRYANIEVAYLLQKMEEYTGIVILSTNLSKNLDDAFARRMQHTIEFPFPDAQSRARIWPGMFPGKAPLAEDVDFGFLAHQFELAGGNIRNIALAAALMAAEEGSDIRMRHLVIATARELQKMGKMPSQSNFRDYYELIRQKA